MDDISRRESVRGIIVNGLKLDPSNALSDVMIQSMLNGYGENMTNLQVRNELYYLEDKQLIEIKRKNRNVWFAKLNSRGVDFIEGRLEIDGVNLGGE